MSATTQVIHAVLRRLDYWGPEAQGSTRPAALLRIGLGCIALIRFAEELAPWAMNGVLGLGLSAMFFAFAAGTVIGANARLSVAGLGATILMFYTFSKLTIGPPGWGHHHVYLLGAACMLLALTDCGKSFSLDRMRAISDGHTRTAPREYGLIWGQRLIALQLSAMYFWAAVDKTDWAFVSGQRLEQTFVWVYSGRALEFVLEWPAMLALASFTVVVVEYWLAVAILIPRWRLAAITVGLSLHASFYLMLPVNTYSITAMMLYLALLDPGAVHRFIDRMLGYPEKA